MSLDKECSTHRSHRVRTALLSDLRDVQLEHCSIYKKFKLFKWKSYLDCHTTKTLKIMIKLAKMKKKNSPNFLDPKI